MVVAESKINLQNSPIYNISMCSLENFHTCFLKWLGENYSRQFLNVLLNINIPKDVNVKFETQVRYSKDTILDLQIINPNPLPVDFVVYPSAKISSGFSIGFALFSTVTFIIFFC